MKKNQVKNFQNSANIQDQLSRSCFDISPDMKKKQNKNKTPKNKPTTKNNRSLKIIKR